MVNEMIDNEPHGEVTASIIDTFKSTEARLVEHTQRVEDEEILAIVLAVIDDLHFTQERYKSVKQGLSAKPYVPCESKQNLRRLTPSHIYDPSKKTE